MPLLHNNLFLLKTVCILLVYCKLVKARFIYINIKFILISKYYIETIVSAIIMR